MILVALVDIVVNLWPRRLDMGAVEGMSTDGAQLVSVFTTPEQWQRDIEQLPLTPEQALLVQTFFGGDVDEASEMARAQVAADPTDDATSTLTGTVLLLGGHWREAFDRLAPHAAEPDADPILANNAAWAAVMTFDPSLLPWADWLSEQAFGGRPTEPACANTRGATLVLLGRPTEGLPLLELAGSGRLSRKQKASVLAFTALAEHQLGRSDDADRHLAESASNDDDCAALPEIRRLIGTVSANRSEVLQPSPWPPPNPHELIGPT